MAKPLKHALITGASSGIGRALALYYARAGLALSLNGRNNERLESVAEQCLEEGARAVFTKQLCVTDREGMKRWLWEIDEKIPVDLVVANAGIGAGTGGLVNGETPEQVRTVFDVNLQGVLNTIDPLLPRMIGRQNGSVALMSSLAGFRGWPGAPSYCASKAAVKVYGEGLRGAIWQTGVNVHVICPGFVKSAMTDANNFPMPFKISAERAAQIIARGIRSNKGRIAFPLPAVLFAWMIGALPDATAALFLQKMPHKSRYEIKVQEIT